MWGAPQTKVRMLTKLLSRKDKTRSGLCWIRLSQFAGWIEISVHIDEEKDRKRCCVKRAWNFHNLERGHCNGKGPGETGALSSPDAQSEAASDASAAGPEASEPGAIAPGSGSPRSSLRTTSARMDHEVIFMAVFFLPWPVGGS